MTEAAVDERPKRSRGRIVLGALGAVLALGALSHVPAVRGLVFGKSGCPFDPNSGIAASPEQLEDFRVKSVASLRTGQPAPSRPALGFQLGTSTKSDVDAWASTENVPCTVELAGAATRCNPTGGEHEDLYFRFDPTGHLVGVDVVHRRLSAEAAAERMKSRVAKLEQIVGPPSVTRGSATQAHLGGGRLSQATVMFQFADYAVDITATSFAETGARDEAAIALREQYKLLTSAGAVPGSSAAAR